MRDKSGYHVEEHAQLRPPVRQTGWPCHKVSLQKSFAAPVDRPLVFSSTALRARLLTRSLTHLQLASSLFLSHFAPRLTLSRSLLFYHALSFIVTACAASLLKSSFCFALLPLLHRFLHSWRRMYFAAESFLLATSKGICGSNRY